MKVPFLQIAALLIPVVTSIPLLEVDIHVTDDTHGSKLPVSSREPISSKAKNSRLRRAPSSMF